MKKLLLIPLIVLVMGCSGDKQAEMKAVSALVDACDDEGDTLTVSTTIGFWGNTMTVTCSAVIKGDEE